MSKRIEKVLLGRWFAAFLFVAACIITAFRLEFVGAILFAAVICLALVVTDDVMATTLPFLLMSVFLARCYDSYSTFIVLWPCAFPVAAVLVYHFVKFRKKAVMGKSFYGVAAVAVAVTLGGLGSISAVEYFSGTSMYYVGLLGAGMVVFYLLVRPQIVDREYDLREKFADIMCLMGMLTVVVLAFAIFEGWREQLARYEVTDPSEFFKFVGVAMGRLNSKGNYCTFLMFAMPFAFYKSLKNKWHVITFLTMIGAIFSTSSRAGMLLGGIEFLICIVFAALYDKKHWWAYVACAALPVCVVLSVESLRNVVFWRFRDVVLSPDDPRVKLISRAIEDFKSNIIFGRGLGYRGNADLYDPKSGAMQWYHMMIPQIIGSMGAVGVLAYGYQIASRIRLAARKKSAWRCAMALSYLGILLMSQANPGEFCPVPYELLTVMIFMLIEYDESAGNPALF